MRTLASRVAGRAVLGVLMLLSVLFFAGPLLWFAGVSVKRQLDIFTWPPTFFRFSPTLGNYASLFASDEHFQSYVASSLQVALLSTLIAVPAGVGAAYALARNRVRHARGLAFGLLVLRMLPPISLIVPYYLAFLKSHLLGTYTAVAITHTVVSLSIVIWLLKGFFDEIPPEVEEAAQLDGCSRFQVLSRIILPMSTPAVVASVIFSFLTSWNEFLFASMFTQANTQTLTVAGAAFLGDAYISWGQLAAATTIGVLPAFLLTLFGQRFLLYGLAPGAVK